LLDSILSLFDNGHCKNLIGKPKINHNENSYLPLRKLEKDCEKKNKIAGARLHYPVEGYV
jgi:hypothetical protein